MLDKLGEIPQVLLMRNIVAPMISMEREDQMASRSHRSDRPVLVDGIVEHGDARGRLLGFPTANIHIPDSHAASEQTGVWAGWVHRSNGDRILAAISVGRRPSFYLDGLILLEAHLIEFTGDLYDEHLTVELHYFVRSQRKYSSVEHLVDELHRDVAQVRIWGNMG